MTVRSLRTLLALTVVWLALPGAGAEAAASSGRIVFSSQESGTSDLYTIAPDGSGLTRLTWGWATEQSPTWSPDGSQIAYESSAAGLFGLYVMGPDGSERRLAATDCLADDTGPVWSPDGRQIAFASTRCDGFARLWVVNADGTDLRRVTDEFAHSPTWSPDGRWIAYVSSQGLAVIAADGSSGRLVAGHGDRFISGPAWSPDGASIAVARNRPDGYPGELFLVAADGSGERQLTSGGFLNANPSWSPDGSELVFQRSAAPQGAWQLHVASADGSAVRRLTSGWSDLEPAWGPASGPAPVPPDAPRIEILSPQPGEILFPGREVPAFYLCSSAVSFVISCEGTVPLGALLDTSTSGEHTLTVTATDVEGRTSTASVTYTVLDLTPPRITVRAPADGAEYDLGSEVYVDFECTDGPGGSGIVECGSSHPNGYPVDTSRPGSFTFEAWAVDREHNIEIVTTHYRVVDRTPPSIVVTTPAEGATYLLGEAAAADFRCEDEPGGSGLAWCKGSPLDTASVGAKTFTVTAGDRAGNEARVTRSYTVVYRFHGFFPPVAAYPAASAWTAGETVPVKFSLQGDQGTAIFAAGSPSVRPCGAVDGDAPPARGTLSYNAAADRYLYLWQTEASWAGTCNELEVRLNDGTVHRARFTFGI